MRKILITGANGLIGQHIGKQLLSESNFNVLFTGVGNCRIKAFEDYYTSLDISKPDQVKKLFLDFSPDVVINCAAISHVDVCEENPTLCESINVFGVKNLVIEIQKTKNCKLVHLSSDFVFSGDKLNYEESDIPNPISEYGKSKLKGERIIIENLSNYQIVRTVLVYGFGEALSRNNILTWTYNSLKEQKRINVVSDQFRSPTYVVDLADAIIQLMENQVSGIFHISGFEVTSVLDFSKTVAKVFNFNQNLILPITTKSLNELGSRPPSTSFNLQKIRKLINFQPKTIIEGLTTSKNQLTGN